MSPSSIAFSSDTDGGDLSAQDTDLDRDVMPVLEVDAKDVVKIEVEEVPPHPATIEKGKVEPPITKVVVKDEKVTVCSEENKEKKKRGRKPGKGASKNIPIKRVAIAPTESTILDDTFHSNQDEPSLTTRPTKRNKSAETQDLGPFESSCFLNTPKGLVDSLSRYFTPGNF